MHDKFELLECHCYQTCAGLEVQPLPNAFLYTIAKLAECIIIII